LVAHRAQQFEPARNQKSRQEALGVSVPVLRCVSKLHCTVRRTGAGSATSWHSAHHCAHGGSRLMARISFAFSPTGDCVLLLCAWAPPTPTKYRGRGQDWTRPGPAPPGCPARNSFVSLIVFVAALLHMPMRRPCRAAAATTSQPPPSCVSSPRPPLPSLLGYDLISTVYIWMKSSPVHEWQVMRRPAAQQSAEEIPARILQRLSPWFRGKHHHHA